MKRPSCTVHKRRTSQQHVCYTLYIMQILCLPLHDWHHKTAKWDKQSQTVPGSPNSSSLTCTPTTTGKYFTTTCLLHFKLCESHVYTGSHQNDCTTFMPGTTRLESRTTQPTVPCSPDSAQSPLTHAGSPQLKQLCQCKLDYAEALHTYVVKNRLSQCILFGSKFVQYFDLCLLYENYKLATSE